MPVNLLLYVSQVYGSSWYLELELWENWSWGFLIYLGIVKYFVRIKENILSSSYLLTHMHYDLLHTEDGGLSNMLVSF